MTDVSGPWRCEKEGSAARSSGEDRATNPYDVILGSDARPWLKEVQRDMAMAWWGGWDKADRELAGSVVRGSSTCLG